MKRTQEGLEEILIRLETARRAAEPENIHELEYIKVDGVWQTLTAAQIQNLLDKGAEVYYRPNQK